MKSRRVYFSDWLKGQLSDPQFKKAYKEEDVRARLALRISEIRQKKGITQAQLAKRLHTSQQAVSDIEKFKHTNLTLHTLQKIAQALHSRLIIDFR